MPHAPQLAASPVTMLCAAPRDHHALWRPTLTISPYQCPVLAPVPFPPSFPQRQAGSNSLSMERNPEFAALGALGLAGICRETLRVAGSRPPGFAILAGEVTMLTLSLLAHIAISRALFSEALASSDAGAGLRRLAANWAPFFLVEAAFLVDIIVQWLSNAAFCVFSVAPRYGVTDDRDARSIARDLRTVPRFLATFLVSVFRGDSRSAARLVRTGPKVAWRLVASWLRVFLLLLGYTAFFGTAAAWLTHGHLLDAAPRAALLLGGAVYLAGAVYIGAVWWRVACVMLVLEDVGGFFRAMHMSDELLAGKSWAAAAVFSTIDGCVVAVQLAFGALVVDDRMGLGVWLRVAAGVVMAVALWAALTAGFVAQVVVFLVCKSYQRERELLRHGEEEPRAHRPERRSH
ncbi:hypothetical protein CFC21_104943 [Triticum aestivum]|uniref:Uncharacterized protein n=2 Tax=Triticum aestivum TaxID=4565 RepID=A0A9R1MB72_WHEAT|nr:uncharacterized protein LOC123161546 [Triticum aestivum]KAF7104017.1 hypothetical protein CFC21_104943 [Triticum aestivum]